MAFWKMPRKQVGKAEQEALFRSQDGRCNYCGRKLGMNYLHVDHKVPLARGGSIRLSNLQLLCSPCNTRKGGMTDGEFRRKYALAPARQAKGPSAKVIPQQYFEKITKQVADKRRERVKTKEKKDRDFWGS